MRDDPHALLSVQPEDERREWTNIGANTLNCTAKDSSFLGDNSLDVDLVYTFAP